MSAETDLYAALAGSGAVTAVVGNRIFADVRQQETDIPAITHTRTGTDTYNSIHTGHVFAQQATMQVSCLAKDRESAEALGDAVYSALAAAGFVYQDRDAQYEAEADLFISNLVFIHNWSN